MPKNREEKEVEEEVEEEEGAVLKRVMCEYQHKKEKRGKEGGGEERWK